MGFNDTQNDHLLRMDNELRSIQAYTDELWADREKGEAAILELRTSLSDVEAQLEATVDEYTTLLGSHEADLAKARRAVFEKESDLFVQAEEHRMQKDKIGQLEGELKTTNLILTSKEGEIASLHDKVGQLRFESNEKKFEADTQVRVLKRDLEEKDGEIEELEEELQGMREERDRADRDRGEVSPFLYL
jgi:chromosome segregation ATPase